MIVERTKACWKEGKVNTEGLGERECLCGERSPSRGSRKFRRNV